MNYRGICFFLAIVFLPSISPAQKFEAMVTEVISGDEIKIGYAGGSVIIRLAHIDAPEPGQQYFDKAKALTEKLALNKGIRVYPLGPLPLETPGFIEAEVYVPSKSDPLNRELIRSGLAWCKPGQGKHPYDITYSLAKKKGLGLWSCKDQLPPWEYVAATKEQARIAAENKKKAEEERQKNAELIRFVMTGKTPEVLTPVVAENKNDQLSSSKEISDIDLFSIIARHDRSKNESGDSFINVDFHFKSQKKGGYVPWHGQLNCDCSLYNLDDITRSIYTEQKTLTGWNDDMFIKIPSGKYSEINSNKVIVKCTIYNGNTTLQAEDSCTIEKEGV